MRPDQDTLTKNEVITKPVIRAEDVGFEIKLKEKQEPVFLETNNSSVSRLNFFLENQSSNAHLYLTPDLCNFYPDFERKVDKNRIIDEVNKDKNNILSYEILYKTIFCCLDFSGFAKWEETISCNFYDTLKKRKEFNCILTTLKNINTILAPNGNIKIFILNINPKIQTIKLFLKCAYFDNIIINENIVTAQKQKCKSYSFDNGKLIFKETTNIEDIKKIQNFAKNLFKDKNFDISIDSLFIPNSIFYYCYRTDTKKIVNFMRYTWYLPKYPLPCMLASKEATQEHMRLSEPKVKLYGEIFAPFNKTLSAVKAYKEFVKNLLEYCLNNNIYKVYTTYSVIDSLSGIMFNQYFGFTKSNIILKYGDFKDDWILIEGKPELMSLKLNKFIGIKEKVF
jgi:hypothetical protein